MEGRGNTDYAYQEDIGAPQEQNQYGEYYYNSAHPEAVLVPKSNYNYTYPQLFTSLAIDGQTQDTDIFMLDPTIAAGNCPGRRAPATASDDDWTFNLEQNYNTASASTGHSILNFNINTPSTSIDGSGRHSSYVVLTSPQSGTYSEHSNGHDSDGPLYSVPGDPEPWSAGSAFPNDTEGTWRSTIEEEVQSYMQHDPKELLVGLSSPEPQIVFDPYQVAGSPAPITYQQPLPHHNFFPQQQSFDLPSRARTQPMRDDPWTPVDQRMRSYPHGYAAFAPSPGPNVNLDVSYSGYGYGTIVPPSAPATNPSSQSHGESRTSPGRRKVGKGKETEKGWEYVVVARGGLLTVSGEETKKPTGCRTGSLDQKTKEKAHRIRKMGACWNCWVQKVPCSEGEPCDKCSSVARKQSLASAEQLCWRSGFKEYESTFFPEFMHAHLRKSKIEDLVSAHTAGFLDRAITVEVSAGEVFRPMRLHTNTFAPSTDELLQQNYLPPAKSHQTPQLVQMRSVPIGIMCLSPTDIKRKCKNYVEEMILNPQYADQTTAGDVSQLPKQILKIMCGYAAAQKDASLLRNALKLHAIHYFMSCLVTFTDKSAHDLYTHDLCDELGCSATPQPYLSSRLLNRQIKYVMHKLHREITLHVLEDLERSLRSRTKDSWGPSFCTILILCLCIEHLQSAADIMVVCDMQENGDAASYTRDQSWNACEKLDEYPFRQCKKLFHDIYRSHRDASHGGRGEKAFNPLRMAKEDERMGLDKTTEAMVRAVYGVVYGSWDEIVELSERPAMSFGENVEPNDIRANNTGRLAANFLRSFFSRPSNV